MPIYEYVCPKTEDHDEHKFDLIKPMSEQGKPQLCPEHGAECQAIDYSPTSPFVWGMYDIHWSAGLSSNTHGMAGAKKV